MCLLVLFQQIINIKPQCNFVKDKRGKYKYKTQKMK